MATGYSYGFGRGYGYGYGDSDGYGDPATEPTIAQERQRPKLTSAQAEG